MIRATQKVLHREEVKLITLNLCSILITTFVISVVCKERNSLMVLMNLKLQCLM